jgi:hypothetical protein
MFKKYPSTPMYGSTKLVISNEGLILQQRDYYDLWGDIFNNIPHWNKMSNNQRAGLLVLGYNAPNGPIGAYPQLTNALQQGDIRSAAQNLQRGGPNQERIALERRLLMSGPLNLKKLVGPKIVGEKY